MRVYDEPAVPNHVGPLPVEPTPPDAISGDWRNVGRQVWEERNPGKSWLKAAALSYPPPSAGGALGALALGTQALGLGAAFAGMSFGTGGRVTHPSGVGASGEAVFLATPGLPPHPFFQAGKRLPCKIRHANASFYDDAACVLRGLAIQFAETSEASPLDLLLNSGAQGPLWSLSSFIRASTAFLRSNPKKRLYEPQAALMDRDPAVLIGWIESVRDAPSSYADLRYFSQAVFPYVGVDNKVRYCRFRAMRPDLVAESGLPSPERQRQIWVMNRSLSDDRPLDYLREEFRQRLRRGPVEYRLQIQVRDPEDGDTVEVHHVNRPWDEGRWPWHDLARLEIRQALGEAETEAMRFSLARPQSLGAFRASGPDDYRSVLIARARIYAMAQAARNAWRRIPSPANPYA